MDNNVLLERCTGRECVFVMGASGGSVKGTVLSVRENWLELQTKKGAQLVNSDHISQILISGS